MTTLDQHPIPTDIVADQLRDALAECQRILEVARENVSDCLALMAGFPAVPAGPGRLSACRIQRGQQLLHDDGWWHVSNVERCDLDTVALTLVRVGQAAPLVLNVDPDEQFTVAEPF